MLWGESGKANDYAIVKHGRKERKLFICSFLCVLENIPFTVCPVSGIAISGATIKEAFRIMDCILAGKICVVHFFFCSSCLIFSFNTAICFASLRDANLIFSAYICLFMFQAHWHFTRAKGFFISKSICEIILRATFNGHPRTSRERRYQTR